MPSSAVLANEGVKAVTAGKYKEGIEKLTAALTERPAPLWLLERSKAYLRTNETDLALHDAEKALQVGFERANRDHMIQAQIRRAVTLFRMGRYADADLCAFWATRLIDKAKAFEDDGQKDKVDERGEYTVRLKDVKDENEPAKGEKYAAAMGGSNGRAKELSWRSQALLWRFQALNELEKLPAGHPGRKVNALEKYPKPSELARTSEAEQKGPLVDVDSDTEDSSDTKAVAATLVEQPIRQTGPESDAWKLLYERFFAGHARNSIRSSFYQTDTTINVDFFVKNVPADRFSVASESHKVVMGPIPNVHPASAHLYLWDKIKPSETKYTIKSMKIELVLQKETPGKWPLLQQEDIQGFLNLAVGNPRPSFDEFSTFIRRLGYNDPAELDIGDHEADSNAWYGTLLEQLRASLDVPKVSAANGSEIPSAATEATPVPSGVNATNQLKAGLTRANNPAVQPTPTVSKADSVKAASSSPAYPTSSKKGAVNWDKITVGDEEEEEEDKEGDVNSFFQKLYKDADPDTRRAMTKSYLESGGTSLSTNWAEAKDKKYQIQPPDGAEAKKWD
ncbi:SGS-domain-containing protein [Jackrogersella minutella]|nr:SGS-domain-containing protein [Jackrogersella minutella]